MSLLTYPSPIAYPKGYDLALGQEEAGYTLTEPKLLEWAFGLSFVERLTRLTDLASINSLPLFGNAKSSKGHQNIEASIG